MTIREVLVPVLQREFPGRGLRLSGPGDLVATFPASCAEIADLMIYDEGEEATVVIENVTHFHVGWSYPRRSEDDRSRWITMEVVQFLRALFADRILLWSIRGGTAGGSRPYEGIVPVDVPTRADLFVWSRRIPNIASSRLPRSHRGPA